jgi:DNA-binding response OmpR family regulator
MDTGAGTEVKILTVEDDTVISNALSYNLSRRGFSVQEAHDGREALKLARKIRPDLILLDIMLPTDSGIEVCRRIREEDNEVIVIMLTAKDREDDKVEGLEAGADDYVTKPFGIKELVARINANLKRTTASSTASGAVNYLASSLRGRGRVIEAGDLVLDTKNFEARVKGELLKLRLKEFGLLAALALHPGELMSREELAREVWGHAHVGSSSRTIDVHVRRVRAALAEKESEHEYVHTVRGLGYRFEVRPKEGTPSSEDGGTVPAVGQARQRR